MVGVGYRRELASWIDSSPPEIDCLEIIAEHFFGADQARLRELSASYPVMIHGLGLSLGTPGSLNRETLAHFAQVVAVSDPLWISEHVAFTRTTEVDLGHLNPVRPSCDLLGIVAEHAREVAERCGKPLILENITTDLRIDGTMSDTEFLNRLCEEADCGLLLDVTNLYINSKNHRFDARRWLREIDAHRIVQLHVVGYSHTNGRWRDLHAEQIQNDLWELIDEAIEYAPVQAAIIERDGNFPDNREIEKELRKLSAALKRNGN